MEITYTRVGDYHRPNLIAPESPKIGRWGMLRFNYLRKHREALYTIMLTMWMMAIPVPISIDRAFKSCWRTLKWALSPQSLSRICPG